MKKNVLFVAILVFILPGFYIIGCDSAPKEEETTRADMEKAQANVNKAEANLETAKEAYNEELVTFRKEMAEENEVNNRLIVDLKASADLQRQEERAAYNARIAEMEQKNSALNARIADYKDEAEPTGKEKWQTFRKEFRYEMEALGSSIDDFVKKNDN